MRFSKEKFFSALIANLVVLLPLIAWGAHYSIWPPDRHASSLDPQIIWKYTKVVLWWAAGCVCGNIFIGLPTFYRRQRGCDLNVGRCLCELILWAVIASCIIAVILYLKSLYLGSEDLAPFFDGFVIVSAIAAILLVPATMLGGVTYWYLAVRSWRSPLTLVLIAALFLLWGFFARIVILAADGARYLTNA